MEYTLDGRLILEYRGVKAVWSHVYQSYRFVFRTAGRPEPYGVPNAKEFHRLLDELIDRAQARGD